MSRPVVARPGFPKAAALVAMIGAAVVMSWGLEVTLWALRLFPTRDYGTENGGN